MIDTARLKLRSWREDDAEALFRYASDGRVSELALWPRHESVEMSRYVIENYFMTNSHTFAIVLKDAGEAIGCMGLVPDGEEHYLLGPDEREVGYWIGFPYWGRGIATEALMAFIAYCSCSLRIGGLIITTDARNIASQRVAEKCGFKFVENYLNEGIPSKVYRLEL